MLTHFILSRSVPEYIGVVDLKRVRNRALGAAVLLCAVLLPASAQEQLSSLKAGREVYSNVTVTAVTATDIFFSHTRGVGNAKLKDLEPEWQRHFHFDSAKAGAAEKKQLQENAQFRARTLNLPEEISTTQSLKGLPFPAAVVVTEESQSRLDLRKEALKLFLAKDYDQLERLARRHRISKETFPDGTWKLGEVYEGLELEDAASDRAWENRLASFEQWIKARPDSITARVALARGLVSCAWKARGAGYMDSVSQAAYRVFVTRARHAMNVIEAAAGLKEKCPFGTLAVLTAARGIGAREEQFYRPLYDGIAAERGFVGYYESAVVYLLPRWFGKMEGDAEFFLKRQADKLGGEEGDVLYARIAWLMESSGMFSNAMGECHFSWERVDRGFRVLERRYPDALSVKSAHARLAGFVAGSAVTRRLIEKLDGKVDPSVWTPLEQFREHVRFAYGLKS